MILFVSLYRPCLPICLSLSSARPSQERHVQTAPNDLWPWIGPDLAELQYVMYDCSFVDDVVFAHDGQE